jgi:hypothetical protein
MKTYNDIFGNKQMIDALSVDHRDLEGLNLVQEHLR